MSGRTRLVTMIVVTLVLIAATIAAIPYRIEEEYVNRRTGDISRVTVTCLVSRSEPSIRREEDIAAFGALTAPDEWLLVSKHVFPFPWSHVSMQGHWLAYSNLDHWSLRLLARWSFGAPRDLRPLANEPHMDDERFAALMTERLALWNSVVVDGNLEDVAEKINDENERLFPGAVKGVVDTVTVTTTSSK